MVLWHALADAVQAGASARACSAHVSTAIFSAVPPFAVRLAGFAGSLRATVRTVLDDGPLDVTRIEPADCIPATPTVVLGNADALPIDAILVLVAGAALAAAAIIAAVPSIAIRWALHAFTRLAAVGALVPFEHPDQTTFLQGANRLVGIPATTNVLAWAGVHAGRVAGSTRATVLARGIQNPRQARPLQNTPIDTPFTAFHRTFDRTRIVADLGSNAAAVAATHGAFGHRDPVRAAITTQAGHQCVLTASAGPVRLVVTRAPTGCPFQTKAILTAQGAICCNNPVELALAHEAHDTIVSETSCLSRRFALSDPGKPFVRVRFGFTC
jgi:hypothetical protein